jgi:hypothetical protein
MRTTPPTLGTSALATNAPSPIFYVPVGASPAYQAAMADSGSEWYKYKDIPLQEWPGP